MVRVMTIRVSYVNLGSRKAERYGKTFLGIIKDFKQEEDINGA